MNEVMLIVLIELVRLRVTELELTVEGAGVISIEVSRKELAKIIETK